MPHTTNIQSGKTRQNLNGITASISTAQLVTRDVDNLNNVDLDDISCVYDNKFIEPIAEVDINDVGSIVSTSGIAPQVTENPNLENIQSETVKELKKINVHQSMITDLQIYNQDIEDT